MIQEIEASVQLHRENKYAFHVGLNDVDDLHPCDRGYEVTNEVIDKTSGSGWLSSAFDEAENRLHVQKADMSLVM